MADTREMTLPVLPLRNGVVFPHMVVTLRIETEEGITAVAAAEQSDGLMLLVPKVNGKYSSVGTVAQIQDAEGGNLVVEGLARAEARLVHVRGLRAGRKSSTLGGSDANS